MSAINLECCKTAGSAGLFTIGCILAIPLAPIIAVIAAPIFAVKALVRTIEHHFLNNKTLTDDTRAKFGRVAGQNYMSWDGKDVEVILTAQDRLHESMGMALHGSVNKIFKAHRNLDNPFSTEEDQKWLEIEYKRREVKQFRNEDLRMARAFAKAIFPLVGLIWILCTELGTGGASEIGCRVCASGVDDEDKHWDWREEIHFHQGSIWGKLRSQTGPLIG